MNICVITPAPKGYTFRVRPKSLLRLEPLPLWGRSGGGVWHTVGKTMGKNQIDTLP